MSKKAADFLINLSKDPKKRDAFKSNPDATMKAAGLSDADRAAINSRDPKTIRDHLGDDGPPGCLILIL